MLISRRGQNFLFLFFLIIFSLFIYISKNFIPAILLGSILGVIFYPIYKNLRHIFSQHISAIFTCIIIVLVIAIPLVILVNRLYQEAFYVYGALSRAIQERDLVDIFFGENRLASFLEKVASLFSLDYTYPSVMQFLEENIGKFSTMLMRYLNNLLGNTMHLTLAFFMMILTIYAILMQGRRMLILCIQAIPLPKALSKQFIRSWVDVNTAVLLGNGISAIIQGSLAGTAFYFADVKAAIVWGVIMGILAFLPLVGITIVYIPTSIYLLITHHYLPGISLFIFCSILSFSIENLFKPYFIGNKVRANSVFVLYCSISGLAVFGLIGIFYGPLIGSFLVAIFDLYRNINKISHNATHCLE